MALHTQITIAPTVNLPTPNWFSTDCWQSGIASFRTAITIRFSTVRPGLILVSQSGRAVGSSAHSSWKVPLCIWKFCSHWLTSHNCIMMCFHQSAIVSQDQKMALHHVQLLSDCWKQPGIVSFYGFQQGFLKDIVVFFTADPLVALEIRRISCVVFVMLTTTAHSWAGSMLLRWYGIHVAMPVFWKKAQNIIGSSWNQKR